MFLFKKPVLVPTVLATLLFFLPCEPATAKSPLSAAALAGGLGLEVSEILIIGPLDDVRQGIIPISLGIPPVQGKLQPPGNVPSSFPPAHRKLLYVEEFDAGLFHLTSNSPHVGANMYERLIEQGAADRYKAYSATLRQVFTLTSLPTNTDKRGKLRTAGRPAGSDNMQHRAEKPHAPKSPSWGKGGNSKRDYF